MIFQSKMKNNTKINNNQGRIFDPDYNHFKRIDLPPKRTKLSKKINKNIESPDIKIYNQNSFVKVPIQKCSTQRSQIVVLFDKYRILPMSKKRYLSVGRNFSAKYRQKNGPNSRTKYLRLNKTDKTIKNNGRLNFGFENQKSNKHCQLISEYNLSSNENRRPAHEVENQTKFTHCSNSTKTPSQGFYLSHKESLDSHCNKKLRNKVKFSDVILNATENKKVLPDDLFKNPIPEQHSSLGSNSKTNRNQSSITPPPNSKINLTHSNRSSYKSSLFLPVNSIKMAGEHENLSELQGYSIIQDYIEYLNVLANYAQEITDYYENTDDWEELIFLMYKKYYLARIKLFNALFYRNAFFFEVGSLKLTTKQIKSMKNFMNSENGQFLRKQIFKENIKITESLRNIYNLAIEKSGNYINLQEIDNFSCQIFRLMTEQIQELKGNYHAEPDLVKNRLKNILKCGITIAVLDKKRNQEQELNRILNTPINLGVFQNLIILIKQKLI